MIKRIFKGLIIVVLSVSAIAGMCLWALPKIIGDGNSSFDDINQRAEAASVYVNRHGMNQDYCLFLDYGIDSGTPRLFVWSFSENKVVYKAHAMHGPGNGSTAEKPVFSNEPGSNCSSLGKFEVTKVHGARNKTGFFLKGKEYSNSMARARGLMIHGSKWVDANKWKKVIPLNGKCCLGCVTVSTKDMRYLNQLIEKEKDHLLLWSFCSEDA